VKIRSEGAEFSRADREADAPTDGQTWRN